MILRSWLAAMVLMTGVSAQAADNRLPAATGAPVLSALAAQQKDGLQQDGQQKEGQQESAAPQPDPAQIQADNIIRISGLTGLSEQARNLAQQILNEQAAPIGQQYDVVDRLAQQWAPAALQQTLSSVLTAKLNDAQRTQLERILSSATLEAVRHKELQAISQQSGSDYRRYIDRLRANPVGEARLQLIRRLDQAMQFSALLSATREQVYPQLEAVMTDWQRPGNWQAALEQEVLEFLFYVHRSTPNRELEKVIGLYTRPEMQLWLSGVQKQLAAG